MSYKNITELYNAHKNDPPDEILERIRAFFVDAGNNYRKGLLSEEEFYLATHYGTAYINLWMLKNGISVNTEKLQNYYYEFAASWDEWKATSTVQIKPWMRLCIEHYASIEKTVDWVFSVIDACKLPIGEFKNLSSEGLTEWPDIMSCPKHDGTDMILEYRLTDIHKLLRDSFPEGKSYVLHFEQGLVADIRVDSLTIDEATKERHYICTGTITDYVEKPHQIDIMWDKGGSMEVIISKQQVKPWQRTMQTFFNPIPHSKWSAYEVARLTHRLRVEAEYKILRLPYMLGCIEAGTPTPKDKPLKLIRSEKIIELKMRAITKRQEARLTDAHVKGEIKISEAAESIVSLDTLSDSKLTAAYNWAAAWQKKQGLIAEAIRLTFDKDELTYDQNECLVSVFFHPETKKALLRRDWDDGFVVSYAVLTNYSEITEIAPCSLQKLLHNGVKLYEKKRKFDLGLR